MRAEKGFFPGVDRGRRFKQDPVRGEGRNSGLYRRRVEGLQSPAVLLRREDPLGVQEVGHYRAKAGL